MFCWKLASTWHSANNATNYFSLCTITHTILHDTWAIKIPWHEVFKSHWTQLQRPLNMRWVPTECSLDRRSAGTGFSFNMFHRLTSRQFLWVQIVLRFQIYFFYDVVYLSGTFWISLKYFLFLGVSVNKYFFHIELCDNPFTENKNENMYIYIFSWMFFFPCSSLDIV